MGRGIGGHSRPRQGGTDVYITPRYIIERLGPFDLDPCEAVDQPWPCAKRGWNINDDGLSKPWPKRSRIFLNPPYSNQEPFLRRIQEQRNGISLIFGRTETALWRELIWQTADAILFLEGRIKFYRPTGQICGGNSGGPSAFIAYGTENVVRLRESGFPGAFVDRWQMLTGPTDGDMRRAARKTTEG